MNSKTTNSKLELCPELWIFVAEMQRNLDNNTHKDQGTTRGWKSKTSGVGIFELGEECRDMVITVGHLDHPIGGDVRNAPSIEIVLKEAADVANHAMHLADQCGAVEVH
jgi:hypothetical protein